MSGGYDPHRAALVLADAMALGDKPTARKWAISTRTVERYRERAKSDKGLAELVAEKRRAVERDLAELRVIFMREAIDQLRAKMPKANVRAIAGALKIVGELHQVAMAVDDERPDSPDPEAAPDEGASDGTPLGTH